MHFEKRRSVLIPTPPRRRRGRGFSFIEVMIAVVIIGLLAGAVALKVGDNVAKARRNRALADIANIVTALETHRINTGRLPTTSQGLGVLANLSHVNDPWDRPYEYFRPGPAGAEFEVVSYGGDGREGGDGGDADISSGALGQNNLDSAGL